MREFFRGWKRKLGCVTLVLACFFTIGWVRSRLVADAVRMYGSLAPLVSIHSESGAIRILRWNGEIFREDIWSTHPAYPRGFSLWFSTAGMVTMLGNDIVAEGWGYCIPYWLIVVPMTVISAWLLLSKPRVGKSPDPTSSSVR